ncbi:MAG: rhodanese-like domain-containing protein [Bacteroidota bacterium]
MQKTKSTFTQSIQTKTSRRRFFQLLYTFLFGFLIFTTACSQQPAVRPPLSDPALDKELGSMLDFNVPLMGVAELKERQSKVVLLDAREPEEYERSHIEGARCIGYKKFKLKKLKDIPKDATVVLYCSVGYRSEKIGQKLQKAGFTDVYNLYGSIFEWANQGYPLVDKSGESTQTLHTYSRTWSKWVKRKEIQKVW